MAGSDSALAETLRTLIKINGAVPVYIKKKKFVYMTALYALTTTHAGFLKYAICRIQ